MNPGIEMSAQKCALAGALKGAILIGCIKWLPGYKLFRPVAGWLKPVAAIFFFAGLFPACSEYWISVGWATSAPAAPLRTHILYAVDAQTAGKSLPSSRGLALIDSIAVVFEVESRHLGITLPKGVDKRQQELPLQTQQSKNYRNVTSAVTNSIHDVLYNARLLEAILVDIQRIEDPSAQLELLEKLNPIILQSPDRMSQAVQLIKFVRSELPYGTAAALTRFGSLKVRGAPGPRRGNRNLETYRIPAWDRRQG